MSQPDNAEFDINGSVEACMGVLNDIYNDGILVGLQLSLCHKRSHYSAYA